MPERHTGKIKTILKDRGFGFIEPDDGGKDVFMLIESASEALSTGARVEYSVKTSQRGPAAFDVKRFVERFPKDCVFSSFYGNTGNLKPEVFFDAPKTAAEVLHRAGLTSSALRMLFQGFRAFAGRIREGAPSFEKACELYGVFYVEKVVRQNNRGMLPDLAKELFDGHTKTILSSKDEMAGFFRYLTNILCFFGDKA